MSEKDHVITIEASRPGGGNFGVDLTLTSDDWSLPFDEFMEQHGSPALFALYTFYLNPGCQERTIAASNALRAEAKANGRTYHEEVELHIANGTLPAPLAHYLKCKPNKAAA